MKKIWIFFLSFICCLSAASFAANTLLKTNVVHTTVQRIPIPVKVTVKNENWVETISICNTTSNPIPLNDIEFNFNYAVTMPTNIWGQPWAAWHVQSQTGSQVVLLGGTPYTPALQPDPNCINPLTIQFSASPDTPAPTGPFVFKASGTPSTENGKLNITMPPIPETGLTNPQVTLTGMGQTLTRTVAWGTIWDISNLVAGSYTVTSSNVGNGQHTYQANPINTTVKANETTEVAVKYTLTTTNTGNLTLTIPTLPVDGLNNPTITVQGMGKTLNQTVTWGTQWKLTNLAVGDYTVTSSTVTNDTDTYQADPISITVMPNQTAQAAIKYTIISAGTANLSINMLDAPEAGLSNPIITIEGMGKTFNKTLAWGTKWDLTQLAIGTYKVTSSTVSNGTHIYQAIPVNVTLCATNPARVTMIYTMGSTNTGNLTINLPSTPETGLINPQLTVKGAGQTFNQTVAWGNSWQLTKLGVGDYTITSSTLNNGTHTYQANPINTSVSATSTTPLKLVYKPVNTNRPSSWTNIKHVVIIVFENENSGNVLNQPFFKSLTTRGAHLEQYSALTHPSQPNYLALISGSTFSVTDDSIHNINAKHLGNLLNAKGLSWKSYAEAYPDNCFQGSKSGTYYRKHEPFINFINVQNSPDECAKIVPGEQFFSDLAADRLPTYSLYVPDINNDGHDTGIAFADKYFSKTFGPILNNANIMSNTLFIITFDEDDGSAGNKIYTTFVGAGVKPGATSTVKYTHYSTLKTIEDIFQLGTLGVNDQSAAEILDIWEF
ncbi:Phospholipase C [Legionella busanensis]|uniref:Phospholipase C n=1 Tax=Legionella busanensis TaxID=190655 RepID=A0A378JIW2_9GAMM|nr:alkaline phosphatase family protein [Legionella busanensis]STX51094.1 Phospholipase C [Legionella busanensis]